MSLMLTMGKLAVFSQTLHLVVHKKVNLIVLVSSVDSLGVSLSNTRQLIRVKYSSEMHPVYNRTILFAGKISIFSTVVLRGEKGRENWG